MTKLSKLSKYLTTHHFEDILADMKSKGVKLDNKNKITGLRFFNSADDANISQVIFLDRNIQLTVSRHLAKYGIELRSEFKNVNAHSHSTICTRPDYDNGSESARRKIVEAGGQVPTDVFLLGLVALTVTEEEIFIGLEVHIPYVDKFRAALKLPAIEYPHITTSHLWRDRYEKLLVPTVRKIFGVEDTYHVRVRKSQDQRKNSQVQAGGRKNTQDAGQGLSQAGGGKPKVKGQGLSQAVTGKRNQVSAQGLSWSQAVGWKESQVVVKSQSQACLERTCVVAQNHSQAGGGMKSLAQGKCKAGEEKESQVAVQGQIISQAGGGRNQVVTQGKDQAGSGRNSLAQGKGKAGGGKETHPKIQGQNKAVVERIVCV